MFYLCNISVANVELRVFWSNLHNAVVVFQCINLVSIFVAVMKAQKGGQYTYLQVKIKSIAENRSHILK